MSAGEFWAMEVAEVESTNEIDGIDQCATACPGWESLARPEGALKNTGSHKYVLWSLIELG